MRVVLPLLLTLIWTKGAWAGSMTAELDRADGAVGEPFILTVAIEGARDGEPLVPTVDGLEIHQQGVSESTSWVNGQRSAQLQLQLLVVAARPGTFTIPSIRAKVDGQDLGTVPLTLRVAGQGQGRQPGPQGTPPGRGRAAAGGQAQPPPAGDKTGGVFLERSCDNLEPYVGEQVLCTIRLYHRGNLNGGQRVTPSSPEFRRFPLDGEKRAQKLVGGLPYLVIELKEIIVPTKAGAQVLPPYTIDARILTLSTKHNPLNKLFDRFGGGGFNFDMNFTEEHEVTLRSEPTAFTVKALPAAGQPAHFSGLVGDFQLEAQVSQPKVAAGNTVTVTITLSGSGIADALGDVAPAFDPAFKVYPDKPEYTETVKEQQGIQAKRVYKYALVPSKPGQYQLGQVAVGLFDLQSEQYKTLTADLGTLIVDPGKAEEKALVVGQQAGAVAGKEEVKVLGSDLLGAHRVDVSSQQTITKANALVLGCVGGLPVGGAFLALALTSWRRRRDGDLAGKRRSLAYKVFKQELQSRQVQVAAGHVEAGLVAAYLALRTYLGDRLNRHGPSLAAREIQAAVAGLGASPEHQAELGQIVQVLDRVEFGGKVPPLAAAGALVTDLERIILALEQTS